MNVLREMAALHVLGKFLKEIVMSEVAVFAKTINREYAFSCSSAARCQAAGGAALEATDFNDVGAIRQGVRGLEEPLFLIGRKPSFDGGDQRLGANPRALHARTGEVEIDSLNL